MTSNSPEYLNIFQITRGTCGYKLILREHTFISKLKGRNHELKFNPGISKKDSKLSIT